MGSRTRFAVPARVVALIRGLHPEIKSKVRAGFDAIGANPTSEGKALKRELEGLRSFRVGRLRIVYRIRSVTVIEIVAIGPRRVIYDETLRLLKRESHDD